MATHSSILAQRIPWMEEPVGLLSIGSHTVGHDCSNLACMHSLEKEMATHSSILAGESQRRRSLVGCRLQGRTESDTTEGLSSSSSNPSTNKMFNKKKKLKVIGQQCYLNIKTLWFSNLLLVEEGIRASQGHFRSL